MRLILEGYKVLGDLSDNDEVLVASNTYIATVIAIKQAGLTPVLVASEDDTFNFNLNDTFEVDYTNPQKYLYEPNAAIMKSGAFDLIPERYQVQKLHKHSHLYTNDELISFPGRQFIINKVTHYQKKYFKEFLTIDKANISIRNFPESVAFLRKKLRIKDGGDLFLFFTTTEENKKIIVSCTKV